MRGIKNAARKTPCYFTFDAKNYRVWAVDCSFRAVSMPKYLLFFGKAEEKRTWPQLKNDLFELAAEKLTAYFKTL